MKFIETLKKEKCLIIINPKAGKLRSRNAIYDIVNALCLQNIVPEVLVTQKCGHATEFLVQNSSLYKLIVCCGGDGTVHEVVSGCMKNGNFPPIAYIPAGSTNDLAVTLGLPTNIQKASQYIYQSEPRYIDIGKMNTDQYFTYIASFGAFTKTSYSVSQEMKNRIGYAAYLLESAKELTNLQSYKVKFTYRNLKSEQYVSQEEDLLFFGMTNSYSCGGVMKLPKKQITLDDGINEILAIRKPANTAEFLDIIRAIITQDYTQKQIMMIKTDHAIIESDTEIPWSLDGEYGGSMKKAELFNIHNKIQYIY